MLDLISADNLHLSCQASNKKQVLSMLANVFQQKGYVSENCTTYLCQREQQISTFLGNGITLPYLPKSANHIILTRGVEIFQFPEGVIWDRSNVMFIAIGVIAKQQEHIEVLKEIASIFSDEIIANALSLISNKADFLRILKQNNQPI